MAAPQNPEPDAALPSSLPDRVERYKLDVERVVREVGEHPQYEMKRSCLLSNLAGKIEFVKDVQSIATSKIETEKFLVIGADEKTRTFFSVTNSSDFDDANIRQILDKYLSPVPVFDVFQMRSTNGLAFVLFVFPRQPRRRILAKQTVVTDDPQDLKPKVLLREGDLWTKGSSTGKRLAKVEDWDDIYEEVIEAEAERRARVRTAHTVELALAREKVSAHGRSLLPTVFTDEEFQALIEDVCSTKDEARFKVLLERLRDDTVEGWHGIGGYEDPFASEFLSNPVAHLSEAKPKFQGHIKNVLRPAMRSLTLAGIYTVKYGGPSQFLDFVADLLKQVFETSHKLRMPRALVAAGQASKGIDEHISHTVPALEALISLHLIGAYIAKRNRFEYLRSLLKEEVWSSDWQGQQWKKRRLAFWPLDLKLTYGEPEILLTWGGRLRLCASRVRTEVAYGKLLGSETAAIEALCQYEFCLELNSFLALPNLSPETGSYIEKLYPESNFVFRAQLIDFPMWPLHDLATGLFAEVKQAKPKLLNLILFDPGLTVQMRKPGADKIFGSFLDSLAQEQAGLWMSRHQFPPDSGWPELRDELKRLREQKP